MVKKITRRNFLATSATAAVGVNLGLSAKSYARILGANDRINLGFLGCGARSEGHRNMVGMSVKDKNLGVVAVCDIWRLNREKAAADCKNRYGEKVKEFKYSEDMLNLKDLDGVMIATGDHQHAKILAEVVRAGKDCYCEKPLAIDLECKTGKGFGQGVQSGGSDGFSMGERSDSAEDKGNCTIRPTRSNHKN